MILPKTGITSHWVDLPGADDKHSCLKARLSLSRAFFVPPKCPEIFPAQYLKVISCYIAATAKQHN
jgi:hypothetical protein